MTFDEAYKLLMEDDIIILPEEINHDTYVLLLRLLHSGRNKAIDLYCRGDGGSSRDALAMADLIRAHGEVTGLLAGAANSSHATIWASCATRYVYPLATIGLHRVSWSEVPHVDARSARLVSAEFEATDRCIAGILAGAAKPEYNSDYWWTLLQDTGSRGVQEFTAQQMIDMGMALPIAKRVLA